MSLATVHPITLLSPTRLDILSRLPLAKNLAANEAIEPWSMDLYQAFLKASTPSLKFSENGTKFSIFDYVHEFQELVLSLKNNGFDSRISTIPFNKNGITNGAHRVAAAIALEIEVQTEESEGSDETYDWSFIKRIGLPDHFSDAILYDFVKLKSSSLAFLITDQETRTIQRIENKLKKEGLFVGSKSFSLTQLGARRLIAAAYQHNDWWQEKFIETMTFERFAKLSDSNSAHLVIITAPENQTPREIKEELRSILPENAFERMIHGTDTHQETLTLSEFILNANSLHFNNMAPIGSETRIINELLRAPEFWSAREAIDGSAVLEVFGIRMAKDIDYISCSAKRPKSQIFDLHNDEYNYFPHSPSSVISDPRLHFFISGIKFASLGVLLLQKSYKLEPKNLKDLQLITAFLNSTPATYSSGIAPGNVRLWRAQTNFARLIEPFIRSLPQALQFRVRKFLTKVRILAERIFRY